MALRDIKASHHFLADDSSDLFEDSSEDFLLDRYYHDPSGMQELRLALAGSGDSDVHEKDDRQVLAAVSHKLKSGHVKVKKDPCDRSVPKNKTYRDFIDAHKSDAAAVAASLKTTTENILGLSALESTFGTSRFAVEGNNFFGMHGSSKKPRPNQKGLMTAKEDSTVGMSKYDNYRSCAESFAQTEGKLIVSVSDPKQFATILQTKGKFGIGPKGPLKEYVPDLMNVISNIAARINCP